MPVAARAKAPDIELLSIEERIERRAYERYVQRGNQSGSELEDWVQAEEEVLRNHEYGMDEDRVHRQRTACSFGASKNLRYRIRSQLPG